MSKKYRLEPIQTLDVEALQPILLESVDEGYNFIQKLIDEYQSGKHRFNKDGAVLIGVWDDDNFIGIGGIHTDPYLNDATIGRIRHVYVLSDYRRSGVGRDLMYALMSHARKTYGILTLRTLTEHGDKFYRSLGFVTESRYDQATHWFEVATSN